jgi:hypothetical protein
MSKIRSQNRRVMLGLVASPSAVVNINSVDESVNGIVGWALGIAYGLQSSQLKSGVCYDAVDSTISLLEAIYLVLRQIYLPWNLGYLAQDVQDLINMSAAIYAQCQLQTLINVVSGLLSVEGISTIGAQVGGALIYEIPT